MKFKGGFGIIECQAILTEDHVYVYFATDRTDRLYRFTHDDFVRRTYKENEVDDDERGVIFDIVLKKFDNTFNIVDVQKLVLEKRAERTRNKEAKTPG